MMHEVAPMQTYPSSGPKGSGSDRSRGGSNRSRQCHLRPHPPPPPHHFAALRGGRGGCKIRVRVGLIQGRRRQYSEKGISWRGSSKQALPMGLAKWPRNCWLRKGTMLSCVRNSDRAHRLESRSKFLFFRVFPARTGIRPRIKSGACLGSRPKAMFRLKTR
jgi:hypothetical protein